VELEPSRQMLAQHARRERTEALAELDLQVHHGLHLPRAGVAEDAPIAERAGAELHPTLEPADDLLLGEESGRALDQVRRRELLRDRARRRDERRDLLVG